MAKRGRPKSDKPKYDYGTPELRARREAIAPNDQTLATSPLDALKARGNVSAEAYTAANYFAALRKLIFGKAHPQAVDLTAGSRGGMPDELDVASAERKYRDACAAVNRHGRQALDAIENVVVHERWPGWMANFGRGKPPSEQVYLEVGLAALLGWYRGQARKGRPLP